MSRRTHELILAIVATDRTFEQVEARGEIVFAGKCIHCNKHLHVRLDGRPISKATIEHIRPKAHGGTSDLENIALACGRCNNDKGVRHDHRPAGDPKTEAIIARLAERRRARWREAPGRS